MPEPASPHLPVRVPLPIQALRFLAILGLGLGLTFALDPLVIALCFQVGRPIERTVDYVRGVTHGGEVFLLTAAVVVSGLSLLVLSKLTKRLLEGAPRARTWTMILLTLIAVCGIVLLVADPGLGAALILGSILFLAIGAALAGLLWMLRRFLPKLPRSRRALVWTGVAAATAAMACLYVYAYGYGWLPSLPEGLDHLDEPSIAAITFVVVGFPLVAALMVRFLRTRSGWWIAGGYLALAPVFAYLAADDSTLRHPMTVEEIAPAFPGAEASYEVLMRYGKQHPLGRAYGGGPQLIWKKFPADASVDPAHPEKFRRFLQSQRTAIEADWADLAPIRAWWTELAAFDRIGDLSPGGDHEVLSFQAIRTQIQLACAIAGLQALDGQGDAAFSTLQPVLEVARKLEPSSRDLLRLSLARFGQQNVLNAAAFVLDTTPVSPAARARMAAALAGGPGGEAEARRLVAVEYANTSVVLGDVYRLMTVAFENPLTPKLPVPVLRLLGSVVYNPRRTMNAFGDLMAELQDLAARRDSEGLKQFDRRLGEEFRLPHFKNFAGGMLVAASFPSYSKVIEIYWKLEDARAAFLTRLAAN